MRCQDCNRKAKKLYYIHGQWLAEVCAADKLGVTASTFKIIKQDLKTKEENDK